MIDKIMSILPSNKKSLLRYLAITSIGFNLLFLLTYFATTPNHNYIEKDLFLHRRTFSIVTGYSKDYQLFIDNYYNKTNMKKVIYASHNSTITYNNAEMRYIDFSQKLAQYFSNTTINKLINSKNYKYHLTDFLRTVIALETDMVYSDMDIYYNNNTAIVKDAEFIMGLFKSDDDYEGIINPGSGLFYLEKETLQKLIHIQNTEYLPNRWVGAANRFFHKYINNVVLIRMNYWKGCKKSYLEFPIIHIGSIQRKCLKEWNLV